MSLLHLRPVARRWRFVAAVAGVTALAGGGVLLAAPSDPATALAFHPVPAERVLDTRLGGATPFGVGTTRDFVIPGLPDDARSVSINVTVVDGTEGSFLTVYPTGDVRPTTSTVNWDSAGAVANSANVIINSNHSVTIFNLKGTVNVVIDLLGYYAPSPVGAGPAGPIGPVGPASVVPGPVGPVGPGVYLAASHTAQQTVVSGEVVAFGAVDTALGGITADITRSVFTVPTDGVYKVTFGVLSDFDSQVDLLIDSTQSGLVFGAVGLTMNQGTAVLTLEGGQTISVGNFTSTGGLGLQAGEIELSGIAVGGTALEINAWIVIEQLS